MKILNASWGGRGEHGILEVYMNIEENKLILSLCDSSYSDWSHRSQLTHKRTGSKSYDMKTKDLTKKYLYDCVIDLVENECNIMGYKIKEEDIYLQIEKERL